MLKFLDAKFGLPIRNHIARVPKFGKFFAEGRIKDLDSSAMLKDIQLRLNNLKGMESEFLQDTYKNLIGLVDRLKSIIPESSAKERIALVSIYKFLENKSKSVELTISTQDLNKLVEDLFTCLGINTYRAPLGLKVISFFNLFRSLKSPAIGFTISMQGNLVDSVIDLLKDLKSLNTKLSGDKTMPPLLDFDDNELQSAAYAQLIKSNEDLDSIKKFKIDNKYGSRSYNLPEGKVFWNYPLIEVYKFFRSEVHTMEDKILYLKHYISTGNFKYGFGIVKELLELIEINDRTIISTNGQIVFDIFKDFINSGHFDKFKNQFFILMIRYLSNYKIHSERFTDYIVAQGKGSDFEAFLDNSGNTIPKNVTVLDDAITPYANSLKKSLAKQPQPPTKQEIRWKLDSPVVTQPTVVPAPPTPVPQTDFTPPPRPATPAPPAVLTPPSPAIPAPPPDPKDLDLGLPDFTTPPRPVVTTPPTPVAQPVIPAPPPDPIATPPVPPSDPEDFDSDDSDEDSPPDVDEDNLLRDVVFTPPPLPAIPATSTDFDDDDSPLVLVPPRTVVTQPIVPTAAPSIPMPPDPDDDSRPVSIMPLDTSNIDQLAFNNFRDKLVQNRAKVLGYLTELGLPKVMLDQLVYPENPTLNNRPTLRDYYKSMYRFFYSTDAGEKRRMGLIEFLERIPAYKSNPKLNELKTFINSIFQEIESPIRGISYDTDDLKADLRKNEKQLPINLTTNDLSFINIYSFVNPTTKKMLELFLGDTNDPSIVEAINLVIKFKGDLQNVKELYKLEFPAGLDQAKIYKYFFAAFGNSQINAYLESIKDLETTTSTSTQRKIRGLPVPFTTSTEERKVVKLSGDFIIALTSIDYSVIASAFSDNKAIVDRLYSDPDTLVSSFDKFSSKLKTDILLRYYINDERKPTWIKLVQKDFETSRDLYRYFEFPEDITNPPKPDGNNRFSFNFKNAGIRKFLYILRKLDLEGKGHLVFLDFIGSLDSLKGATNTNEFNELKNKITKYLNTKAKPEYKSFVERILLPELNRISFTEEVITAKKTKFEPAERVIPTSQPARRDSPIVPDGPPPTPDASPKKFVKLDEVLNNDIHTINLEELYQGHHQRIQNGESLSEEDMVAFLGQILYVLVNAKDTLEDDPYQIKQLVELINFAKQYLSDLVGIVSFGERDSFLQQRGLQGIYFVIRDMSLPRDITTIKFSDLVKTIANSVKPHEAKTIRILPGDRTVFSIGDMQKPVIPEGLMDPPDDDDDDEFDFPPSARTANTEAVLIPPEDQQRLPSDHDTLPLKTEVNPAIYPFGAIPLPRPVNPAIYPFGAIDLPRPDAITETEKDPKRFNKPSPDNIVISEDSANEYLLATNLDLSNSYFIDSERSRALFFDINYINKVKDLLENLTQDKVDVLEDIITKNGSFKRLYDITDEDTLRVFISTSDNNNDGNKLLPLIKNNPDSKNSLIASFSNTFDTIKGKINKNEKPFDTSEILLFTLIARFIDIDKLIKE